MQKKEGKKDGLNITRYVAQNSHCTWCTPYRVLENDTGRHEKWSEKGYEPYPDRTGVPLAVTKHGLIS